ncbi:MAG: universal stress protein [Methanomicrobiaceae archaeon]|nr:universal stress protein [Methanomicrobiaceae archaeon]
MLFEKIVFATDFSRVSDGALDYVLKFREVGSKEVVLVHVLDVTEMRSVVAQPSGMVTPSGEFDREVMKRFRRNAEEKLEALVVQLEDAGFQVRPHLIDGIPWREIVKIAAAEKADCIVMGSHGRSNVVQMFLGSVTENVIGHAHQPIFVVRREAVLENRWWETAE